MTRRILAGLLFPAGAVWTIGFPKSARLDPDLVLSVAISLALFGTGIIVLLANRIGRARATLSIALLMSLLANACLISACHEMRNLLLQLTGKVARSR